MATKYSKKRKMVEELRAAAREYTKDALDILVRIMRSHKYPAIARIAAAKEVLDRGHGRSVQPMRHEGEVHHTHEAALAEVQSRIAEIEALEKQSVH